MASPMQPVIVSSSPPQPSSSPSSSSPSASSSRAPSPALDQSNNATSLDSSTEHCSDPIIVSASCLLTPDAASEDDEAAPAAAPAASTTPPAQSTATTARESDPILTISVTNLPYVVRWQELKDLVKGIIPATDIVRSEVFIIDDDNKRSQGSGSIIIRGRESANKCVETLNGFEWHGRPLAATIVPAMAYYPMPSAAVAPYAAYTGRQRVSSPASFPLNATVAAQYGLMPYQIPAQPYAEYYEPSMQFGPPPPALAPMSLSSQQLFQQQQHQHQHQGLPYFPPQLPMAMHHQPTQRRPHNQGNENSSSSSSTSSYQQQPQQIDKRKVFIGNIPFTTQWRDLREFVQTAGKIVRIEIIMNDENKSRGFAIAVFETDEDAQNAIDQFDGQKFQGRALTVRLDKYPDSRPPPNHSRNNHSNHSNNGMFLSNNMSFSAPSSALTSSSSGDSSPKSRDYTSAPYPNGGARKHSKYGGESVNSSRSNSYSSPGMQYYPAPFTPDLGGAGMWPGGAPPPQQQFPPNSASAAAAAAAAAAAYWSQYQQGMPSAGYAMMQNQFQGMSLMPSPAAAAAAISAAQAQGGRYQHQQPHMQSYIAGPGSYGMPGVYQPPQ
ncbi:hypothetical protein BZA70DRAFT_289809 [Myxozyma melibiosi]|uniref:RRM domain-containing protein n=1 Tax=Myxozyma melibiosi TaxID=54550 RepID=A0ABR1F5P8_9ASCO